MSAACPTWHARTLAVVVLAAAIAACSKQAEKDDHAGDEARHAEPAKEVSGAKDGDSAETSGRIKLAPKEAERSGVKVEEARAQTLADTVTVTATIGPDEDRFARMAPRIAGRITAAAAKLGDNVRAGQVMATLDSVEVGESSAGLAQAQAELRIADAELRRIEPLAADEIIPRRELLRAQADRDRAAAAVRAASDRLRVLGGSPGAAARGSTFTVIAPFAGTVIEKAAVVGELGDPAKPMFTVADLRRVWIQANLPETSLAKMRVGANAKVTVPAYPGETFSGRVGYIGAGLNKETRTVAARIEVANGDGHLKPEMFATATIEVMGDQREAISLPDPAIVLMNGQPTVFVYEQGVYMARPIEPGERLSGRTVVKAGIKAGEQVVTAGAYALKARQQKSQLGHGH